MMTIASLENVSVALTDSMSPSDNLRLLEDISFELYSGETLALLGESGSGKSLTALAIMRLLPERAAYHHQSTLCLEETSLLDLPECLMRTLRGKRIGLIFQEPMTALNPVLTIGQQLAEAIVVHEVLKGNALSHRMNALLRDVELPLDEGILARYPHQLSGGQKQRVVIAMALAHRPEVLIADEPTTALDVTIQAQILTLLKKLQVDYQMSMLLITHDLGVVKAMASRVCLMYAGQVIEVASVDGFFNATKHPYAQQLLRAQPNFEQRGFRLQPIDGNVPSSGHYPTGCRFHPRCLHQMPTCSTVSPALLTSGDRQVRCHLYPMHDSLPALPLKVEPLQNAYAVINESPLLSVSDLSVSFQAQNAVSNLSFDLYRGRTLALVGESGSGKTTTAKAIMGLLPHFTGEVTLDGTSLTRLSVRERRRRLQRIQFIFQDPVSSMNPRLSIADIIAEGMVAKGESRLSIRRTLAELLEAVNLPLAILTRYPHELSGGQRQRVCIARALAVKPEILICDEPTSALDMSVQAQILNLLKSIQLETGIAYLFITHNMSVVHYMADEVIVLQAGRMIESGPAELILKQPKAAYTQLLLRSVLFI